MAGTTRAAWGAVAAGLGSVLALPIAIYATRFSDTYELIHASVAIPVGAVLGALALSLARRERRRAAVSLTAARQGGRAATIGRSLGFVGLCLAASGLVALAVYGLLEYAGSR
ncbi:MAG TPA: hypothetical protein VFO64_07685 [Gaiellaceae bacterium]|nr:hypothetical protein [Gaiellaceae bacterium]